MKFLDSSRIDKSKWDALVASSTNNNVFCYSWYLDATCKKWGAIITNDYSFGLPLPYKNRYLFKKIFQHPYSRNIEYFGDSEKLNDAIDIIEGLGKFSFNFNHHLNLKANCKVYQYIDFTNKWEYKKNAQRIIAKNQNQYQFKITNDSEPVINLYFINSFNKIKQQKKNKSFITQLIKNAIQQQKGESIEVYDSQNKLCAAAFFLKDKQTVCYLIGDCNPEDKKHGAMFSLMDFAITHYQKKYELFDFGGSNVESVATFYKKMGGIDQEYYEYSNK
jgi:hypothetical protein